MDYFLVKRNKTLKIISKVGINTGVAHFYR